MRIEPVPCLRDNYAYLIIADDGQAAVVDPGCAAPIQAAVAAAGARLVAAWCTHHHPDHTGGVAALRAAVPALEVVAHGVDAERFAGVTRRVADGDTVELGALRASIVFNPGHTLGAVTFVVGDAAFTGDTLFGAGCGRLFEGTAPQFHASLMRLAALPAHTRVFFGHEYTAANLAFATAVEPANVELMARRASTPATSTPSTIATERATNPFLRAAEPAVIAAAQAQDPSCDGSPAAVFATLRRWKDGFRA
ncbi:MAG: hydroxyacylglutathione hydrolase [Kofleriaceae bacterium]